MNILKSFSTSLVAIQPFWGFALIFMACFLQVFDYGQWEISIKHTKKTKFVLHF